MREAPSIDIVHELVNSGAQVRAYDPVAMEVAQHLLPEVKMFQDPYEMAAGCDGLMVITEWNEFKQLDLDHLKQVLKTAVVFDGRNVYDPQLMRQKGFTYRAIGRGSQPA